MVGAWVPIYEQPLPTKCESKRLFLCVSVCHRELLPKLWWFSLPMIWLSLNRHMLSFFSYTKPYTLSWSHINTTIGICWMVWNTALSPDDHRQYGVSVYLFSVRLHITMIILYIYECLCIVQTWFTIESETVHGIKLDRQNLNNGLQTTAYFSTRTDCTKYT